MASRSAIISHQRKGDKSSVKPTTSFLWWSQACKQPNTRPKLCTIGSRHKLWATTGDVWMQNYQNAFNHSREDWRGDLQVRQTSLHLTWKYQRRHFFFPRVLQQNLLHTNKERSAIYSLIFRKTLIAKYAEHKSCESAMHNKSWRSGGQT